MIFIYYVSLRLFIIKQFSVDPVRVPGDPSAVLRVFG